jgi:hypothetical protein
MARSAATTRSASAGSLSKRDGEEVKVFLIADAAACEEGPEGPAPLRQPSWRWHLGKVWVEKTGLYTKL